MSCNYCKYKEAFEFYHLKKENAEEVLDKIGFGKKRCEETYEKDGRFGTVECDHINFGFRNKMNGKYYFGNYIVFDILDDYPYRYMPRKEFFDEYEVIDYEED